MSHDPHLPALSDPSPRNPGQESTRSSRPDASRASLTDDELTTRKKDLVSAFDALVDPLDQILRLLKATHKDIQGAYRGGLIFLILTTAMAAVQVHSTMRMAVVQAQLAEVVEAQKQLQQTTALVVTKQTEASTLVQKQAQITLEPGVTPEGEPTAIVVVKPPPGSDAGAPTAALAVAPLSAPAPALAPPRRSNGSTPRRASTPPRRANGSPPPTPSSAAPASTAPPLTAPPLTIEFQ